ncbi:3-oxoacyl-(acyl-carrier-protein) reductase [Holotrichia oblita]|nr:3-oxoacyl-(acyl-carrier-protein) reductase [Holotrichia oblita]
MGGELFAGKSGGIYDLMKNGPAEELNKTLNAQQAIFLHGLAEAEALKRKGIKADCAAGLSLGEITALAFAGVLKDDGFVRVRAEAMQACCEKNRGAMLAVIKLSPEKVISLCKQFKEVWPVNFNSPEQTVCSCSADIVDAFSDAVASAGGRALKVKANGAFHSPHMNEASKTVAEYLTSIKLGKPEIPVFSNVTARPFDNSALISKQISSPVLWQQIIENMIKDGVDSFIECGPGTVLSGLVKKIAGENVQIQKAEELLWAKDQVAATAQKIAGDFGGVDVLVNNAGITRDNLAIRMSETEFDEVIAVNLKGVFNCCKHFMRAIMKSSGGGRIINISSISGISGTAGQANYAASKAGVIAMTKVLARELGGKGVTVNAIAPGFIDTDMTVGLDESIKEHVLKTAVIKRFGKVGDIASAVSFLASPEAGYITGQTLVIDGGLTL